VGGGLSNLNCHFRKLERRVENVFVVWALCYGFVFCGWLLVRFFGICFLLFAFESNGISYLLMISDIVDVTWLITSGE